MYAHYSVSAYNCMTEFILFSHGKKFKFVNDISLYTHMRKPFNLV
jgi:hypothetical protein